MSHLFPQRPKVPKQIHLSSLTDVHQSIATVQQGRGFDSTKKRRRRFQFGNLTRLKIGGERGRRSTSGIGSRRGIGKGLQTTNVSPLYTRQEYIKGSEESMIPWSSFEALAASSLYKSTYLFVCRPLVSYTHQRKIAQLIGSIASYA